MARTAARAASVAERQAARAAQKKYGKASLEKLKGKTFKSSADPRKKAKKMRLKTDRNGVPITGGIIDDSDDGPAAAAEVDGAAGKKPRAKPNWSAPTRQKRAIKREVNRSIKKPVFPYTTFKRMVKRMLPGGYLLSDNAVRALREVSEAHCIEALECARYVAETMHQKTVRRPHLRAVALVTNKMQTPTPLPGEIDETLATPTDLGIMPATTTVVVRAASSTAEPTVEIGAGADEASEAGSTDMLVEGDDEAEADAEADGEDSN